MFSTSFLSAFAASTFFFFSVQSARLSSGLASWLVRQILLIFQRQSELELVVLPYVASASLLVPLLHLLHHLRHPCNHNREVSGYLQPHRVQIQTHHLWYHQAHYVLLSTCSSWGYLLQYSSGEYIIEINNIELTIM